MADAIQVTTPKGGWRSRLGSVVAGLVGLALLVGLPLALVRFVGNPIDLFPDTLEEFTDGVERRYLASEWIIGALTIVMWFLWAQFVWALLWEVLVSGPAAARGRVARAAPLVPRFTRSLAGAVVSGMLASSVVVGGTSLVTVASNLAIGNEALATAPAVSAPLNDTAAQAGPQAGLHRVHTVGQRDTLWSIAGQNEQMVARLLDLNEHQLRSPLDLRPGMELVVPSSLNLGQLPGGADDGVDRSGETPAESVADDLAGARAATAGSANGADADDHHIVVEGDNLWEIAEARLRVHTGEEPSNREVAEQVNELVDENPTVIEDPDLIYPGEELELPEALVGPAGPLGESANGDHATPADSPAVPTPTGEGEPADPGETLLPGDETLLPVETSGDDGRVESPADLAAESAGPTDWPVPAEGDLAGPADPGELASVVVPDGESVDAEPIDAELIEGDPDGQDPGDGDPAEEADEGAAVPPLVGAGLVVGTALVALIAGWKRRLRGRAGAASTRDEIDDDGRRLLQELTDHADRVFTNWAAEQLRLLRAGLSPDTGASPLAVWLGRDTTRPNGSGLTVEWDRQVGNPPPGWDVVDERRWHRRYDELAPAPDEPGPAAVPGLVTLGRVIGGSGGGRQLLIDLESVGSLALGGRGELIESAAESIILEAGAGGALSNLRVTTVGFELPAAGRLERVRSLDEDSALAQAEAVVEQFEAQSGPPGTFRPGTPVDGSEDVELFVVRTVHAVTDRWMSLAKRRRGVAVLLVGDMRSTRLGARLAIDDDGTGVLSPWDERLEASGVTLEASQRLADLFDRLLADPADDTGPVAALDDVLARWPGPAPAGGVVLDDQVPPGIDPANAGPSTPPMAVGADAAGAGRADGGPEADTGDPAQRPATIEIQVLGPCRCDDRPDLVARPLSLVAFLALQPGMSASSDEVVRALWGDAPVAEGELARVVAAARAQVGAERLPKRRSDRDPIQLVGVETDLDRFRRLIVRASTADRVQAADDLAAAMGLLTGPPLGGVVAEWAEAAGLVDHLCELVEATTIRAIEAAIAADLVDRVPRLAMRGLVALPANEPIYRAYMKVAADAGGPDLVGAVYDHLRRAIATQSPMEDRHPSEQTSRLRARLVEEAASGLAPSAARPSEQPSAPEPPRHPG